MGCVDAYSLQAGLSTQALLLADSPQPWAAAGLWCDPVPPYAAGPELYEKLVPFRQDGTIQKASRMEQLDP